MAAPETLVLRLPPDAPSSRVTSYQSTWPAERDQNTRKAVEPAWCSRSGSALRTVGAAGSKRQKTRPFEFLLAFSDAIGGLSRPSAGAALPQYRGSSFCLPQPFFPSPLKNVTGIF